ncbi:MAG: LysR substrate-binding domain-containing protein [Pseudomonadota bacterium]
MPSIVSRLEIRQLRYFVAVVDAGSFSRAAGMAGVAQPALSQQIAQLEDIVGAQLLLRSRTGVKPNAQGIAMYRHAEAILRLVTDTEGVVQGSSGEVRGRVRLGLPSSIAFVIAGPLFTAVQTAFPGIHLELYESPSGYLAPQLANEHVELSVLVDATDRASVQQIPLVEEVLFFVSPSPLTDVAPGGAVTLQRLQGIPLVLTTSATSLRQIINAEFLRADVVPVVQAEVSSVSTMLLLAASGPGGSIVPGSAIAGLRTMHVYPLEPPIRRRAHLAFSSVTPLSEASERVRAVLLQTVAERVQSGHWPGATLLAPH